MYIFIVLCTKILLVKTYYNYSIRKWYIFSGHRLIDSQLFDSFVYWCQTNQSLFACAHRKIFVYYSQLIQSKWRKEKVATDSEEDENEVDEKNKHYQNRYYLSIHHFRFCAEGFKIETILTYLSNIKPSRICLKKLHMMEKGKN